MGMVRVRESTKIYDQARMGWDGSGARIHDVYDQARMGLDGSGA